MKNVKKISKCDDDIRENNKKVYIYNSEWKLYVLKHLINMEN